MNEFSDFKSCDGPNDTSSDLEKASHGADGTVVYQRRFSIEGKVFLVRVAVNEMKTPKVATTVYRTSKLAKYWSVK